MSGSASITMTPEQLQELLKVAVSTAVTEAVKPNILEQRAIDEALARDKRQTLLKIELARAEEEAARNRELGCTHARDARKGHSVPAGSPNSEWTTSGQAHGNGMVSMICMRCAKTWRFKATPEEFAYYSQNGMLGHPPPPNDRLVAT